MNVEMSRYAVLGSTRFRDRHGQVGRMAYVTSVPRTVLLTDAAATALENGRVNDLGDASVRHLLKLGLVVEEGTDERQQVISSQRRAAGSKATRYFVLVPTGYCNMGCDYCGQTHTRGQLPKAREEAIVDRVLHAIHDPEVDRVDVGWYGGEPMMAYAKILDWSQRFTQAAAATGTEFAASMTTNGALLTVEKVRTLSGQCAVTEFGITLDGPQEVHDAHRPLKSGRGSYNHIIAVLRDLFPGSTLGEAPRVKLRINVDVRNIASLPGLLDDLAESNLRNPQISIAFQPIYNWSNDLSEIRVNREEWAANEIGLLAYAISLGLNVNILPKVRREVTCAAVSRSSEVISSTGNVFSCTEHPLVPRHEASEKLSNVVDLPPPQLRPKGLYDDWHDTMQSNKTPCGDCWLLPVCGGSCPKHWDEGSPPCPSMKINLTARLDLVAKRAGYTRLPERAS
jgi:uncharacterized protein